MQRSRNHIKENVRTRARTAAKKGRHVRKSSGIPTHKRLCALILVGDPLVVTGLRYSIYFLNKDMVKLINI